MAQKFLGKKAVAQAKKHAPPSRHAHQISKQRKGASTARAPLSLPPRLTRCAPPGRVVFKNNKESKAAAGERTVRLCAAMRHSLALSKSATGDHAPHQRAQRG